MRVSCTIIALALTASCGDTSLPPRGQVVLVMDTDAPLESPPLFDRVKIDIFPPGEDTPCAGCSREVPVDVVKVRSGRFSFGFVPRPRELGWRVRLRMFRTAGRGGPRPGSTIELVGFFPAVAEEGIVHLTATFRTEDLGVPRGTLASPIVFDRGVPSASLEGTWPGARPRPCKRPAPEGAVCVTGGPTWLGDPRVNADGESIGGAREHIAVLSAFHLDAHEVTVAEMRASGLAVLDSRGRALDPQDDASDPLGSCDYTTAPGPWEDRPVNCVSRDLARRFCQARGGDLPTEAQLEMVASLRGTSLTPWRSLDATCGEAAVILDVPRSAGGCGEERGLGGRILPAPPGSGSLDRVAFESGEIVDLGANLSEWVLDDFAPDESDCWRPAILADPRCETAAPVPSVRGGHGAEMPLRPAQQRTSRLSTVYDEIGFRCAYPAEDE